MRERLFDLMCEFYGTDPQYFGIEAMPLVEFLIDKGVIVPPVKVGQTVWVVDYVLDTLCVFAYEVDETMLFYLMFHEDEHFGWGKTVFATKKEAKRALAKMEK